MGRQGVQQSGPPLGDRKPTEFLMYMHSLHQNSIETWERATLLNALLPQVRAILSNSNATNNKRLARKPICLLYTSPSPRD